MGMKHGLHKGEVGTGLGLLKHGHEENGEDKIGF